MGYKQRPVGGWALTLMGSQLARSEKRNKQLAQTSHNMQSVLSFFSAQNSTLRSQLLAAEEELHTVRQKLAAYEETASYDAAAAYEGDAAYERDAAYEDDDALDLETSVSGVFRAPLGHAYRSEELDDSDDEPSDPQAPAACNLTLLSGVDEMTQQVLNALGIYTYRQIVDLEADGWDSLAALIPALGSSIERVRWRHEAETLCHAFEDKALRDKALRDKALRDKAVG